jgi:H+/Cl- antiporter ClcA
MESHRIRSASTTDGLPVAPSMGPGLEAVHAPRQASPVDRRTLAMCAAALVLAVAATFAARLLLQLIALITNVSFYGRFSFAEVSPAGGGGGVAVLVAPVVGAIVVGLMARYGSVGLRGHGIPEAMERILLHESRIPLRITFLKPLSSAFAIGTGGPFGAEGPIIATGGALGSALGQFVAVTAVERKTLLAAGAAAGMTAIFGSPVAAVLLAIELLLFEYRPRSVLPVALAATMAGALRFGFAGDAPIFDMPAIQSPGGGALRI